jgi:hypothetical protein
MGKNSKVTNFNQLRVAAFQAPVLFVAKNL